jgi:hypothetical protein
VDPGCGAWVLRVKYTEGLGQVWETARAKGARFFEVLRRGPASCALVVANRWAPFQNLALELNELFGNFDHKMAQTS